MSSNLTLHERLLSSLPYNYNEKKEWPVLDLVNIMGSIYVADVTNTARKRINTNIPVLDLNLWKPLEKEINNLVTWVSGENFRVTFSEFKIDLNQTNTEASFALPTHAAVTLFSGGLDSLTGAFWNYKSNIVSDYVGFINKDEEKTHQEFLKEFYFKKLHNPQVILIPKPVSKKKHTTQSTRSLLYISLAIATAFYNESNDVYLYENGVLSLNPSLVGRRTTKTTHPKTFYLYQSLIEKIGLDINLQHPFIFKTKGENINAMDSEFKSQIKHSFTCGAGRANNLKSHTGQCGVCIPCLLRKISLAAYDNEHLDSEYYFPYETKIADISKRNYKKEYDSNLNYFMRYSRLIKEGKINEELHVREKFYNEKNYNELNLLMLNKFSQEFERYMAKYDPN